MVRQVSSVLLRQNPHNVNEWQKRVKLFAEDPRKAIICYTEVRLSLLMLISEIYIQSQKDFIV